MTIKLKKAAAAIVSQEQTNKGQQVAESQHQEAVELPAESATAKAMAESSAPVVFGEVGLEASITINLGNYNSTRLGVSLKLPALPSEIDDVFEYAKTWVDTRLSKLSDEAQQAAAPEG
jgi:hypothetical protein